MNLTADLFPAVWYGLFNVVYLLALGYALRTAPWHQVRADTSLQHRLGFSLVLVVIIWSLRAGVDQGLGIHFFMVTALHLVFGWRLALLVVTLGQLGMVLVGQEAWQGVGLNAVTSGLAPILTTWLVWRWQERNELYNPFVFIFAVAFGGAILSVLVSGLVMTAVFTLGGVYTLTEVKEAFWIFVPLIALPEGVLNGMLIAGLVVFRPEWVALFDEDKYYPEP